MAELAFWLIIIPSVSLIAVLVLLREQLFDRAFFYWLRGFAGFFVELFMLYCDTWYAGFLEELARELEQQQQARLAYTPLLLDEPVSEKEEESACIKLSSK